MDHHRVRGRLVAATRDGGAAAITLDPGESGEIIHRFDEAGELLIGCHLPGHYESGMAATVQVG